MRARVMSTKPAAQVCLQSRVSNGLPFVWGALGVKDVSSCFLLLPSFLHAFLCTSSKFHQVLARKTQMWKSCRVAVHQVLNNKMSGSGNDDGSDEAKNRKRSNKQKHLRRSRIIMINRVIDLSFKVSK